MRLQFGYIGESRSFPFGKLRVRMTVLIVGIV